MMQNPMFNAKSDTLRNAHTALLRAAETALKTKREHEKTPRKTSLALEALSDTVVTDKAVQRLHTLSEAKPIDPAQL